MSAINTVLHIAKEGLLTHQKTIQVTGHNISNANTEGYSRQRTRLVTAEPVQHLPGQLGLGVKVAEIKRVVDKFLNNQIYEETETYGRYDTQKAVLEKVEMVFSGEYFNSLFSKFWNAWEDLANNPQGRGERTSLLGISEEVVSFLKKTYQDLTSLQKRDIGQGLREVVRELNRLSQEVATLNTKILAAEAGGQNANDYRDKRELVLKQISELIDVNAFEDSDGSLVILTVDGRPLVEASSSWDIVIASDEKGFETLNWQDRDKNLYDITQGLKGGKLGGWIVARDRYVEGYKEDLNTFAKALMSEINKLHSSGYSISKDPNTNQPYTNILFFTGSSVYDMAVNTELKIDPFKIATAQDKNALPGDNRIALSIAELRYKPVLDSMVSTFEGFYQGLISKIGSDVRESQSFYEHQKDMLKYLDGFRESVSGVSIDEEMMNLLIQQRAYQASARVITTVNELMDTLLAM